MYPMSMIGKVRRMHFREGKSVREIARLTRLARNTVRAWLREPEVKERRYRRPEVSTQLTPYAEGLRQALTADARRPRSDRRTVKALLEELKTQGYAGCYSRVTDFVRAWREGEGQAAARTAFVPLAFEWGDAYQFDWSEEGVVVGGVYYRAQVAHLTLCARPATTGSTTCRWCNASPARCAMALRSPTCQHRYRCCGMDCCARPVVIGSWPRYWRWCRRPDWKRCW